MMLGTEMSTGDLDSTTYADDGRRAQRFPTLTEAQIARIAAVSTRRPVRAGEILIEQGTETAGIFVVLSGAVEVVRPGLAGDDLVTVHTAGEFTGEVTVLA